MDSRVAPDTTGLNFFRADPVEAHATELLLAGDPVTLADAPAVASA